jgi:hypothetical protein
MKRLLHAALALLFIGAAWFLFTSRQRISELEDEVAQLKSKRDRPAPKVMPSGAAAMKPEPGGAAVNGNSSPPVAEQQQENPTDLLMGAGREEVLARSDARIALLRDRFKLAPQQEAALRTAAAARNEQLLAAFERIRAGKATPPDLGLLMDWMLGNFPLPVDDLLEAGQADAYAEFAATERTSRIESMASMELMEMQSQGALHLTTEQKDKAFAALSSIIADEDAMGAAYYADDGRFMERIDQSLDRRREAIRAVLDAAQLEHYNRMLMEDRKQYSDMVGGARR